MGQAKSKSWRRLSESDCVHLLNDDELNNVNIFQNPDLKYHTITSGAKWQPNSTSKCTNLTEDNFTRNRSSSACLTPSSEAALLKFSKFDNGEFVQKPTNFSKNLFEPNKHGSMMRKTLPPCPNKLHSVVPGVGLRHQPPPRFYPSILEPEMLLRPSKASNFDAETNDAFRQSDLIESPPPLAESNPFKQSTMRPITMYQFEPFTSKSGTTFVNHRSSVARGMSLSDLLEQCNTFEEEEFSDQTLVDTGATTDSGEHTEEEEEEDVPSDAKNKSNSGILVDISGGEQSGEPTTRMPPPNSVAIRCSGLDCICDRCIQHRFKLLNWLLPNCTRINAERLLHGRMEGTFLVRKSEKFPGQYTLSFVCRRTVRHCLIMRSVYGFGLRWPYSFETLQQVIIHYARTTLAEFNSKLDVRLRYPVFMT